MQLYKKISLSKTIFIVALIVSSGFVLPNVHGTFGLILKLIYCAIALFFGMFIL
jgi:hypothetical protein